MKPPHHRNFWFEQRKPDDLPLPPLAHDLETEVVVVGGGVAGLSCAQALHEKGRKVVLLEKDTCGEGASGRSSGFISPDSEMELSDLIRFRGNAEARRLWEFVVGGVDAMRENIGRLGIECDMQVHDSLFLASSSGGSSVVIEEHEARESLGYASTLYDCKSLRSALGSEECCGGVRYPGTFGINAYRYCQGLRDRLRDSGVTIHEGSAVTGVEGARVTANGFTVRAEAVVLCVDRFLPELGLLKKQVYHAQTFLAASAPLADEVVKAIFPEKRLMVWDSDLIYQYFRVTGDNRLLLGAASMLYTYDRKERDHAPKILRKMRAWLERKFPGLPIEIEYFWPGLIGVSKDLLPLAGRDPANPALYYVSGATGLAWAAALGRYLADKIMSSRADFDALFDPGRRFPVGPVIQALIGKPNAFALAHGVVKYFR